MQLGRIYMEKNVVLLLLLFFPYYLINYLINNNDDGLTIFETGHPGTTGMVIEEP